MAFRPCGGGNAIPLAAVGLIPPDAGRPPRWGNHRRRRRPGSDRREMTTPVRRRTLPHQPGLDGLRGVAVTAVLLFHGGSLTGGYLGVDAFFVLSGFLITSLLLLEHESAGSVSLGAFWARRARRLLPALAATLVAVALYAQFLAEPTELATIRDDALWTLGYLANWHQVFADADYFALFRSPSPLQHTWSLAIEEQFYVVWPLVFVLVARLGTARSDATKILVAASTLAVTAFAAAQLLYDPADAARVYYGTDTRVGAILVGAALAAGLRRVGPVGSRRGRAALEVLAVVSAIGLAVAWSRLEGTSTLLYRGGLVACAIATAAVIAAAVHPQRGLVARGLSWAPLRGLGVISYGVYLWHWPIYVVLSPERVDLTGRPLLAVRIAVTVAVAVVSYRLVERPIRRGAGSARTYRWALPAVAIGLVGLILASTSAVVPAVDRSPAATTGGRPGGVLLVGDSVAHSLFPGMVRADVRAALVWSPGCRLLDGELRFENEFTADCDWETSWPRAVATARPDVVVMVIGAWDLFDVRPPGAEAFLVPGSAEWDAYARTRFERAIQVLGAGGAHVVIPSLACQGRIPGGAEEFEAASSLDVERVRASNRVLAAVVAAHPGRVSNPDLFGLLCPADRYQRTVADVVMRGDGAHFTADGAESVARWLLPQLVAAAPDADLLVARGNTRLALVYGDDPTFEAAPAITGTLAGDANWKVDVSAARGLGFCDMVAALVPDLGASHADLVVVQTTGFAAPRCSANDEPDGPPVEPGSDEYYERHRAWLRLFFREATDAGAAVIVVVNPPAKDSAIRARHARLLEIAREEARPFAGVTFSTTPRDAVGGAEWTATLPCGELEAALESCVDGMIPIRSPDGEQFCPLEAAVATDPRTPCLIYSGGAVRFGLAIVDVIRAQRD